MRDFEQKRERRNCISCDRPLEDLRRDCDFCGGSHKECVHCGAMECTGKIKKEKAEEIARSLVPPNKNLN